MARIMQVVRPSKGGAFGHVLTLARELGARGHEVAVVGPHAERREEIDGELIEIQMSRAIEPLADLRSAGRLARTFRRWKPDLIHTHGSQAGVLGRVARVAVPGVPVVMTPHQFAFINYFASDAQQRLYRVIERALVPATTRYVCVCEDERRHALSIGAGDRAVTVHNGIRPLEGTGSSARYAELGEGGPLIVAVVELHERKGVPTLLEAFARLLDSHPAARLAVAGDGPDRDQAEAAHQRFGLGSRATLLGHVDDVPALLGAATVFVNPAWAEAFPYAILEGMSAGLPSVVTDVGGSAEAVEHGRSGLVVPAQDPGRLAAAMAELLEDPARAGRMGDAARERVLQQFTEQRMIDETVRVYAGLGAG